MDAESGKAIVRVLGNVLQKLVAGNAANEKKSQQITKFHALRPPSISIADYLERICKYSSCSAECFVLALVYIDRLIQQASFTVSSLNIHRVIITSVMLAAKFFDDHYYNNAYYAKIGGVPCAEMNSLELEFLFLINFTLYVDPESYNKYYMELFNHAATLVSPGTSWKLGIAPRSSLVAKKGGGAGRVRTVDTMMMRGRDGTDDEEEDMDDVEDDDEIWHARTPEVHSKRNYGGSTDSEYDPDDGDEDDAMMDTTGGHHRHHHANHSIMMVQS